MGELNRFTTMHTDIDHNSKETSVSVMFFNAPSDIMTEMLSLHEFLISRMLSKTKIEFSTKNPSRVYNTIVL